MSFLRKIHDERRIIFNNCTRQGRKLLSPANLSKRVKNSNVLTEYREGKNKGDTQVNCASIPESTLKTNLESIIIYNSSKTIKFQNISYEQVLKTKMTKFYSKI